jgi:hypothetical protein
MSGFINYSIGVTVLVLAGNMVVNSVEAVIPEPKAIEVQGLAIQDGNVKQTLMVRSEDSNPTVSSHWVRAVVDEKTGEPVTFCYGSAWDSDRIGLLERTYSLEAWIGNPKCTYDNLPPGRYVLEAAWVWGSDQTSAQSKVFGK